MDRAHRRKATGLGVRYTPALFLESQTSGAEAFLPLATNVGNVPHKIKVEVIDNAGNSHVMSDGSQPTPPGQFTGASKGFLGVTYAKFTVLDGTRADIRAAATVLTMVPLKWS
jgi:hypothetical protein